MTFTTLLIQEPYIKYVVANVDKSMLNRIMDKLRTHSIDSYIFYKADNKKWYRLYYSDKVEIYEIKPKRRIIDPITERDVYTLVAKIDTFIPPVEIWLHNKDAIRVSSLSNIL